jgi:electron transfer flavoprotein alpha subunit
METKDVWIVAEHAEDKLHEVTFEMLEEGRQLSQRLGSRICVVSIGYRSNEFLQVLRKCDVHSIYLIKDSLLADYTSDAYAAALIGLIEQYCPFIVILAATANGNDLASTVSARLQIGLASGCTALTFNDRETLEATRPIYQDKINSTVVFHESVSPRMVTIRPGAIGIGKMEKPSGKTRIVNVKPLIPTKAVGTKVIGYIEPDARTLDIAEADIIVSGGRGVGTKDNWHLIEELADALGGAVGGSRMVLDEGLITREQLVGQSGKSVKPGLYVALGISGASQHTEGMKESERVIAINKDSAAPMLKLANLSVVADLTEIVPSVIKKLKLNKKNAEASQHTS